MNNHQCVPSWDLDENPITPRTLDYDVAELTWVNGQPAMHGLGPSKVANGFLKGLSTHVSTKYNNSGSDSSGGGGGTLESIVNQATTTPHRKLILSGGGGNDLWFVPPSSGAMDALVPCTNNTNNINPILDSHVGGSSTRVDSCSGARNVRLPRVTAADLASHDWSSRVEYSVSNSGTCGKDYSRQLTRDTCTVGFTSTSVGSQENTSSGMQHTYKTFDDDHDDSVCHGATNQSERGEGSKMKGTGKGSVSTKRSRAAAIHNQSERKRRDKINQRMKTLQKMIPNSSKTDKASMLDEVIDYLKQLQAQIHMVSRMNLPQMMLPLAMQQQQQQQLQMSMMGSPMGMGLPGLGMGMGLMDMNTMGRNNINGMPPVLHPNAFMQTAVAPWDGTGDRMPSSATPTIHDPLAAFLASQSQPMTMDAYTRMATLFQQFYQHSGAFNTKN